MLSFQHLNIKKIEEKAADVAFFLSNLKEQYQPSSLYGVQLFILKHFFSIALNIAKEKNISFDETFYFNFLEKSKSIIENNIKSKKFVSFEIEHIFIELLDKDLIKKENNYLKSIIDNKDQENDKISKI